MNLSDIDVILLSILSFFGFLGWWQGLFRSAIGPTAFVGGFWAGILNFDLSRNFLMSIWVGILTTTIISGCLYFFIMASRRTLEPEERKYVPLTSRLGGAVVSLAWHGIVIGMMLVIISALPAVNPKLAKIKGSLGDSELYSLFNSNVVKNTAFIQPPLQILRTFGQPTELQRAVASPEFENFFADPKIQALMQDPSFHQALNKSDVRALTNNPLAKDVLNDRSLMQLLTISSKKYYKRRLVEGDAAQTPQRPQRPERPERSAPQRTGS